jgi:hypothetical protein
MSANTNASDEGHHAGDGEQSGGAVLDELLHRLHQHDRLVRIGSADGAS